MSIATFDDFTRRAAGTVARRASLMTLGGLVAGAFGLLGWPSVDDADAHDPRKKCKKKSGDKKKKCLKKAKKHNARHRLQASPPPSCTPNCAGKACGDDGCGSSCGSCTNGKSCLSGACACTSTEEVCGETCRAAVTCENLANPCAADPEQVCCPAPGGGGVCRNGVNQACACNADCCFAPPFLDLVCENNNCCAIPGGFCTEDEHCCSGSCPLTSCD